MFACIFEWIQPRFSSRVECATCWLEIPRILQKGYEGIVLVSEDFSGDVKTRN